jgi:uncharacterized protein
MDRALQNKLQEMQQALRSLGRVAVAFSGGVDSVFLLKVAADTLGPANVLAVTGVSPSVPADDLEEARHVAEALGVEHLLVDPGEFEDPNYLANPTNRCYYCKDALYRRMGPLLAERNLKAILSGTNADDLGDYRPGLAAAQEHAVRAPCAEAGLSKAEIRALSAEMGLSTSDKPASPCLASRLPYGEAVTAEKLSMVDRAETFLRDFMKSLIQHGPIAARSSSPVVCRVRFHDRLARVEVPPEWISVLAAPANRAKIDAALREIGFQYVALDLRGFRSGSLNEVIAFGKQQPPNGE